MNTTRSFLTSIAFAALAFIGPPAGAAAAEPDLSILPQGCRDAIAAARAASTGGTDQAGATAGMSDDAMGASSRTDIERDSMRAMARMSGPMMAAHRIPDPDLAFTCGMIAHHWGAIEMSKIELRYGHDTEARKNAERIIDAQRREIRQMSDWVGAHKAR